MALYVLSYVQNMEFRGKLVKPEDIQATINTLKDYGVNVNYVTRVPDGNMDINSLLGTLKRTKKVKLRNEYINTIEQVSRNLGSRSIPIDEFLRQN